MWNLIRISSLLCATALLGLAFSPVPAHGQDAFVKTWEATSASEPTAIPTHGDSADNHDLEVARGNGRPELKGRDDLTRDTPTSHRAASLDGIPQSIQPGYEKTQLRGLSTGTSPVSFVLFDAGLTAVQEGSTSNADVDGNRNQDLLITGRDTDQSRTGTLYQNQGGTSDPPSPPTGLTASAGDCQISLSWEANSEGDLSGYNLYRSTSSFSDLSSAQKINETLIQTTSYSDSNLGNGPTYYYRVTAVDESGDESSPSVASSAPWQVFTAPEEDADLVGGREALQDSIDYPEFAVKAGIEGRVRVRFTVNEAGNACSPTVTKEAHPLLNSEAPETIKRVEFDPAVEGGESVKFRMTLPVVFSLTTMPTGLTGSQTDDQVSLSWNGDPEDELSGFNVYRSTNAFDTTANAQKINEG
ncbi:MAG: hypothetical protein BRD25_05350, partial [Bacteroidetes bacterium QH_1_61_8]